jgi:hypothetical protein
MVSRIERFVNYVTLLELEKERKRVCPFRFEKMEHISHGGYAEVYDIGKGKIVKLTRDYEDAFLSKVILFCKNRTKHAVKFHQVGSIRMGRSAPFFYIVADKLFPLSEEEKSEIAKYEGWFDRAVGSDPEDVLLLCEQKGIGFALEKVLKKIKTKDKMEAKEYLFWRLELMSEIYSLGFLLTDFHSGNIMKNEKGEKFFIDFGLSEDVFNLFPDIELDQIELEEERMKINESKQ